MKAERAAKKEEEVSHQEDDGDHEKSNPKSNYDSRYIPKNIKHKVYLRDGGRCTFVDHNGNRCEERSNLEFDHKTMWCHGGRHSVDNIRLMCREHNKVHAARTLGVGFMENKIHEQTNREKEDIAYG